MTDMKHGEWIEPAAPAPWDDGFDHRGEYVEAAPDGVVAVDCDGVIRYANAAAREMLGPTFGSVLGAHLGFPLYEGAMDIDLQSPTGEVRNAEARVTPVRLSDEDRWVISLRDVTEGTRRRNLVADELRNIDDALAVTSHELRNPLCVLAGTVETMIDEWDDLEAGEQVSQLRRVQRNIMRMAFTVDSILDAARVTSGTFQPVASRVNLLELVLERLPELGDAARGISIDIPSDCVVVAHPDHVWMICANFLVNSLKYGAPPRSIHARIDDLHTVVEVIDAGEGVEPEHVETLFDRYVRAPRTETISGTGLGLWIARSIAEAYSGRVFYRPAAPRGAVFACQLPRTPNQVPAAGGAQPL